MKGIYKKVYKPGRELDALVAEKVMGLPQKYAVYEPMPSRRLVKEFDNKDDAIKFAELGGYECKDHSPPRNLLSGTESSRL